MTMKKILLGVAALGLVLGQISPVRANVVEDGYDIYGMHVPFAQGAAVGAAAYAAFMARAIANMQFPNTDLTSIPTHVIVSLEQDFKSLKTEIEADLKDSIRNRISAVEDSLTGAKNKVDANISNLKLQTSEISKNLGQGLVGEGKTVDGQPEIKAEGGKSTLELTLKQQENYTSDAGSRKAMEEYQKKRLYNEQQQAIRMLAMAVVMRKNATEQIPATIEIIQKRFEESTAAENTSAGGGTISEDANLNKSWRQYAYNGIAYDQMLSLEQQAIGLRLQAKGGRYSQQLEPLADKIEVKGQK